MKLNYTIALLLLFSVSFTSWSDPVTITNLEGKSIDVDIITVGAGTATVKLANGRQYRIPLTSLDEKSQKVIENWKLVQLGKNREPFKISIQNFTEMMRESDTGAHRIKNYNEGYTVTVQNLTPMKVPELRVEYLMLKEKAIEAAGSNKDVIEEVLKGEAKLEPMAMREESTFTSETIPIRESRLKSGWSYMGGGRDNAVDELIGIWIKIMAGDQVIYEYARPSILPNKVNWDTKSISVDRR